MVYKEVNKKIVLLFCCEDFIKLQSAIKIESSLYSIQVILKENYAIYTLQCGSLVIAMFRMTDIDIKQLCEGTVFLN